MRNLVRTVLVPALTLVGVVATNVSPAAAATYGSAYHLGVFVSVDCTTGETYVSVNNTDMQSSSVRVILDGQEQQPMFMWTATESRWYYGQAGVDHTSTIIYDLVPGSSSPEEVGQSLTASCTASTSSAPRDVDVYYDGNGYTFDASWRHPASGPASAYDVHVSDGQVIRTTSTAVTVNVVAGTWYSVTVVNVDTGASTTSASVFVG